ncbi:MAG: hypothetical protein OXF26_06850 [Alphaproteobacteria bacterium]|nr:hypothetical protein [Alphaproteobacteria bacterium]
MCRLRSEDITDRVRTKPYHTVKLGFVLALSGIYRIMEKNEIVYSGALDYLRDNRNVLDRYLTL